MTVPTIALWAEPINDGFGSLEANNREWWRYHFAGLALQGLLANPNQAMHPGEFPRPRSVAEEAQLQAYDLLEELERTAGKKGGAR